MIQEIPLDASTIHGAISLEPKGEYIKPWRIDYKEKDFFTPNQLNGQAEVPAGVRISFLSDTEKLKLEVSPGSPACEFDVLIDGERFGTFLVPDEKGLEVTGLPSINKRIEIYLSQRENVELKALWIEEKAAWQPFIDPRKKWITYGSSITQCHAAESPSQTWPAITANALDLNLICLGYSGQCQYEPMVARIIRDTPADFIHLSAAINSYNAGTYSPRTFQAVLIGFIKIIREKHVNVPIVLSSSIYGAHREDTENNVGFTLKRMREEVEEVVRIFKKNGDDHIHYVNGLDILGADKAHLLPDHLHPNAEGYKLMGERFAKVLERYFV